MLAIDSPLNVHLWSMSICLHLMFDLNRTSNDKCSSSICVKCRTFCISYTAHVEIQQLNVQWAMCNVLYNWTKNSKSWGTYYFFVICFFFIHVHSNSKFSNLKVLKLLDLLIKNSQSGSNIFPMWNVDSIWMMELWNVRHQTLYWIRVELIIKWFLNFDRKLHIVNRQPRKYWQNTFRDKMY